MNAPIRPRRPRGDCGKRPCARRSALGIKLTTLLILVALLLLAFVAALVRGLG